MPSILFDLVSILDPAILFIHLELGGAQVPPATEAELQMPVPSLKYSDRGFENSDSNHTRAGILQEMGWL